MKIIYSIEVLYEDQKEINTKLKNNIDEIFARIKHSNWHYISRVKTLESFALKLETGRFFGTGYIVYGRNFQPVIDHKMTVLTAKRLVFEIKTPIS